MLCHNIFQAQKALNCNDAKVNGIDFKTGWTPYRVLQGIWAVGYRLRFAQGRRVWLGGLCRGYGPY